MSIKFRKTGRRSAEEKSIFNELKNFLSSNSLSSEYKGKVYSSKEDMEKELNFLKSKKEAPEAVAPEKETVKVEEPIKEEPIIKNTEPNMSEEKTPIPDIPENFGNFEETKQKQEWSPLTDSDPIQRSYNNEENKQDFEIPKKNFEPPSENSVNEIISGNTGEEEAQKEPSFKEKQDEFKETAINPYMKEMSPKDKEKSAEQLADTLLGGYEFLHQFGEKAAMFPEEKLAAAIQDGDLDPNVSIPISETTSLTAVEYFQEHNDTVKQVMAYDPEFNEEVKPVLTRVLAKRDWGMTDEQWLIYKFGKDIAMKGTAVFTLKKTANQILSAFIQQSANVAMQNRQSAPDTKNVPKSPDSITRKEREAKDVYVSKEYKEDESYVKEESSEIEDIEAEFEEAVES